MTESSGEQVDAKLRAAVELLCGVILSAEDPVARGEAEATQLREQLLGRLGAASAQLARIERELQDVQAMAGGAPRSGHGGPDGGSE